MSPPTTSFQRRCLAWEIGIGEDDDVADVLREVQRPETSRRERGPHRTSGGLHDGQAGFDALADQHNIRGRGQAHRPTAAGAEHHPLWGDGRLGPAVSRHERAVNANRVIVTPARHERDHARPDPARGMRQARLVGEHPRGRQRDSTGPKIGLDEGACGGLAPMPDRHRGADARPARWRLPIGALPGRDWNLRQRSPRDARPQAAGCQRIDDRVLRAAGMATHKHRAIRPLVDGQGWARDRHGRGSGPSRRIQHVVHLRPGLSLQLS